MSQEKTKTLFYHKKKWIIAISIIVLLVIIRLILPSVILHFANKSLDSLKGYSGHIEDIDLSLYRGAYKIDTIYLNKIDSINQTETPFFAANLIDLSIEWNALFNGRIVAAIIVNDPVLLFTKDKVEPSTVQKDTADFRKVFDDLMPLKVNKFEINNGTIQYNDQGSKPPVDIKMDRVYLLALNLSSVKDTSLLPATIKANANIYSGTLDINLKLDPLNDNPTFDLNAELKDTQLPEFNDFFKAYGNLDINKGTFGLYTEIAAKEGKFTGYVKPVIHNLDVVGPQDRKDTFLNKVWEGLAGAVAQLLENPKEEQVAAKIPLEGNFEDTSIETWYAIGTVLQNAFIQALYPTLDYQVNIGSVDAEPKEKKGFLERIFSKDDDDKSNNKERKKE